jgi:spermidine synthase
MLIHTPLSTHKEPVKILIFSDRADEVEIELNRYKFLELQSRIVSTDDILETLQKEDSETLDTIIFDTKLSENQKVIFAHSSRVLSKKGLLSIIGTFGDLEILSSEFRIAMPYLVVNFEKASETLLFGSKFYHPTADINLQRSDFLDGCNYYNSDIHTTSFVMPNHIKAEIRGFVKN